VRDLPNKSARGRARSSGRSLARLVRNARGSQSQELFAAELDVSQESLSRYEQGKVQPPAAVIAKCWETLEGRGIGSPPAADELAELVRRISGSRHVAVREAIARLIDISVSAPRPGRKGR
jgi:transcriptional regulator with XRE-family HTH domain